MSLRCCSICASDPYLRCSLLLGSRLSDFRWRREFRPNSKRMRDRKHSTCGRLCGFHPRPAGPGLRRSGVCFPLRSQRRGDIAQLVERCNRTAEARGSNPLISTTPPFNRLKGSRFGLSEMSGRPPASQPGGPSLQTIRPKRLKPPFRRLDHHTLARTHPFNTPNILQPAKSHADRVPLARTHRKHSDSLGSPVVTPTFPYGTSGGLLLNQVD